MISSKRGVINFRGCSFTTGNRRNEMEQYEDAVCRCRIYNVQKWDVTLHDRAFEGGPSGRSPREECMRPHVLSANQLRRIGLVGGTDLTESVWRCICDAGVYGDVRMTQRYSLSIAGGAWMVGDAMRCIPEVRE